MTNSSYLPTRYSNGVPIFVPSWDAFQNFEEYINKIEPIGSQAGICKIVPPPQWRAQVPDYSSLISGGGGGDTTNSFEIKKEEWNLFNGVEISRPIRQSFYGSNGVFQQINVESRKKYTIQEFKEFADTLSPPQSKHGSPSSREKRDVFEDLERLYWKTLTFKEIYYGADMLGSLFPSSLDSWNMGKLPGVLQSLKKKIPGVNTPYLYFGSWKATFAWHVEDMDLFSINYLHFGAPKHWYSIPSSDRLRFERIAQEHFATEHRSCSQFLRHKTSIISPISLTKDAVKVNKIIQYPGEFMITFPYGYHQGFNYGFNCAEAVNFALFSWLEKGLSAKSCECRCDNVHIDVLLLLPDLFGSSSAPKTKVRRLTKEPTSVPESTTEQSYQMNRPRIKLSVKYCALCPKPTGESSLPTRSGTHVHSSCLRMFPQLILASDGQVDGLDSLPADSFGKKCVHCESTLGVVIKCSHPFCTKAFHVSCAEELHCLYLSSKLAFCNAHDSARILGRKLDHRTKLEKQMNQIRKGEEIRFSLINQQIRSGIILQIVKSRRMIAVLCSASQETLWIPWRHIILSSDEPLPLQGE